MGLQQDVDYCWRTLYSMVIDPVLWSQLVIQKDRYFFARLQIATGRLDKKFAALSADSRHPCETQTDFSYRPDPRSDLSREESCLDSLLRLDLPEQLGPELAGSEQSLPPATTRTLQSDRTDNTVQRSQTTLLNPDPVLNRSQSEVEDSKSSDCLVEGTLLISTEGKGSKDCLQMAAPIGVADLPQVPPAPLVLQPAPFVVPLAPLVPPAPCVVPPGVPFLEDEAPELEPVGTLEDLLPHLTPNDPRLDSDVVNLSHVLLTNEQIGVLSLGLHFRVTPKKVPVLQLVAGAETAAQEMQRTDPIGSNVFRILCSNTIHRAKAPKPNLTYRQRTALRDLRNNQAITVLTADKGGKVVVLDSVQYAALCEIHLQDNAYELVDSFRMGTGQVVLRNPQGASVRDFVETTYIGMDPLDKLLRIQCRRLTDTLNSLFKNGHISATDRKKVIPNQPYSGVFPAFYGLPKIHKIGILKIRPIVSNIEIYCDKLLIHLKGILNLLFTGDHSVLNSYEFVELIDQIVVDWEDRLASFDVESLFTRVPVQRTLELIKERLRRLRATEDGKEEIEELSSLTDHGFMTLLELMVKDFFFVYHGQLYKQRSGLPMGNRLSPIFANIFMEDLEEKVLAGTRILPKIYCRFVDDIFILYNSTDCRLDQLLQDFNQQHEDIHLTCEHEENRQLAFLDLKLTRSNQRNKLDLAIFRKATHSHRYLHFNSSHTLSMKRNVFKNLLVRNQRLMKNHVQGRKMEFRYLLETFCSQKNGYPRHLARKWLFQFQRDLERNPRMFDYAPKRSRRQPRNMNLNQTEMEIDDTDEEPVQERKKKTLLIPYLPGISDKLRSIANRYDLKSWFSFGGRISENFAANFKDRVPESKTKYSVYKAKCTCGQRYIGESERNLKLRLEEHKTANSNSSLSTHLSIGWGHLLDMDSTEIIARERYSQRRKLLESMAILHSSHPVINTGPSLQFSDMWSATVPSIRSALLLDRQQQG